MALAHLKTFAPVLDGWLIEVSMKHTEEPVLILFAAAIDEAPAAVDAVRSKIGGLQCSIEARCRLSRRALAQLGVKPGKVKSISASR